MLSQFPLVHAQSDISQFEKPRAVGIAHMAMIPGTVAISAFQAELGSNPKIFAEVKVIPSLPLHFKSLFGH